MNVTVTFRPLTNWPRDRKRTPAGDHQRARFDSTLAATYELLDRELWQVGALSVVCQVDVPSEHLIRRDGRPYAEAEVKSPAAVLSFEKWIELAGREQKVPVTLACDKFKTWPDNLRAIALGLEALRRIDRYEISAQGQQYRGYAALPASTTPALSTEQAAEVLARRLDRDGSTVSHNTAAIVRDRVSARAAIRGAMAITHPDAGGLTSDFQLVQEAKRVLEAHHGGTL